MDPVLRMWRLLAAFVGLGLAGACSLLMLHSRRMRCRTPAILRRDHILGLPKIQTRNIGQDSHGWGL